tara:strand:- start:2335 stop:2760 length:426 start_codon:yes stop_codon:yes gene_type:complete
MEKENFYAILSKMRAVPEKVWGETCIPEGEYCIGLRTVGGHHAKYSKRFADIHLGMLHVLDVPNFKYILIHCGNTDEDTAGCLLLGNSQVNNSIKTNGFIGNSTEAYFNVYPYIAKVLDEGQDVTISYKDLSECEVAEKIS